MSGGRPPVVPDPAILDYASPGQRKYLEAAIQHGGLRPAARALGVHYNCIQNAFRVVTKAAAARGYAPDNDLTRPVPEPLVLKGASTLYDADGKVRLQWVKSQIDTDKWEQIKEAAINALADDIPRIPPSKAPALVDDDLLTVYTLTDSHVGMVAWGRETKSGNWDLDIAERVLTQCFERMIQASPAAAVGFVNQLGDFLHQDGLAAVTPTSGHNLDSDGRFQKIVEVAVRVLRRVVTMALGKHDRVVLGIFEGNHDIVSSIWLRTLFAALFEDEPRVHVIDALLPYSVYQHGETLLGFHHGHLAKNTSLPLLIAAQFPKEWGATTKRYVHTGHRHHVEIKEHSGITVHQHPTLAARDAYAARGGWVAERQVTALTYHRKWGQVRADTIVPEMLGVEMNPGKPAPKAGRK
jgi:hypothetical protein